MTCTLARRLRHVYTHVMNDNAGDPTMHPNKACEVPDAR